MIQLKARLALELPGINRALNKAVDTLPEPVRPVARHIFDAGGKRLRPLLTVLTARLLGHEAKSIQDLAITLEMLHAATLLHDDVLDAVASPLRIRCLMFRASSLQAMPCWPGPTPWWPNMATRG